VDRESDHGYGSIFARAAIPDLAALDTSLNVLARAMTVLGDTDTHDLRRAKALGVLADPTAALELTRLATETLTTTTTTTTGPDRPPRRHDGVDPRRGCDLGPAVLYVHVSQHTLTNTLTNALTNAVTGAGTSPGAGGGVVRVEGVGPVLLDQVCGWLGHRQVKLTTVIDPAGIPPVDRYEVPALMGEAMLAVSPAESAPYSPNLTRNGDKDHTTAYVPIDQGGPPGQTGLHNLGRLTRHNHRWKTHGRWNVTQPRPDLYLWRSPHHHYYLVDHMGTTPLGKL
jgi:hypothetical protein